MFREAVLNNYNLSKVKDVPSKNTTVPPTEPLIIALIQSAAVCCFSVRQRA